MWENQRKRHHHHRRRQQVGFFFWLIPIFLFLYVVALSVGLPLTIVFRNAPTNAIPITYSVQVMVMDQVDLGMNGMLNEGDRIIYTIVVKNTGTGAITNSTVGGSILFPGCGTIANTFIQPGENATCSGQYIIMQSDIDAGMFDVNVTFQAPPYIAEVQTQTTSTNLTQMTTASLYVFVTGAPDFGDNMIVEAGDIVMFSTKVMNTGTETLENIVVNDGEHVVSQLTPMQMVLLETNYTLTAMDVSNGEVTATTVVNATGFTSQDPFLTTFTVTVNLTQPIFAQLAIFDRVYWPGPGFVEPAFGQTVGIYEKSDCPSIMSAWVHDINVTNTGTDIVTGVTVEQWRKDALSQPFVSLGGTRYKIWTLDCSPMYMTDEIGIMLPGETQMCRAVYLGTSFFGIQFILDEMNNLIGYRQEVSYEILYNTTRVTNATVTGTGLTTGTVISETTPDTLFNIGSWNMLGVTRRGFPGMDQYTVYDHQYTNAENRNIADTPYLAQNYTFFHSRDEFYENAFGEDYCGVPLTNEFYFVALQPVTYPLQLQFFNFDVHPQHRNGYLTLLLLLSTINGATNAPAFDVTFTTSPAGLSSSWILNSSPVFNGAMPPIWNSGTQTLSYSAMNIGSYVYAFFDIGDLRQYTSITISTSNIPSQYTAQPDTPNYQGYLKAYLSQKIDLLDKTIAGETAGFWNEVYI